MTRRRVLGTYVDIGREVWRDDDQPIDETPLEFSLDVLRQEEKRRQAADSELLTRIEAIDRRTKWQSVLQWTTPIFVALVGIYVGYLEHTAQQRQEQAGYRGGQAAAKDEIRQQTETTEQIAARAGKEGARAFALEFTLRANPPPIASAAGK